MVPAIHAVGGIEDQRDERLDVLVHDVESRWHDADNGSPHAVELNGSTDQLRIRAERRAPELVREHRHLGAVRPRLCRLERPSGRRAHAEHGEELCRDARNIHASRAIRGREIRLARRERADRGKRAGALLELEELRR